MQNSPIATVLSISYILRNNCVVTILSEITSTSVEPNLTISSNVTLAVSRTSRINGAFDETASTYLIINSASLLTTTSIVTVNGRSSTVAAANTNEDGSSTNTASISTSNTAIEYELTVFFDVITSTDNTAVLLVTTNTLSTFRIDSTTVLPLTTNILSTNQMDDTTILSATTNVYSTNGGSAVVNNPSSTSVPNEGDSSGPLNTAAIVGLTVGLIVLIAIIIMTGMVVCILVRKRRTKRKYKISWTLQAAEAGNTLTKIQ